MKKSLFVAVAILVLSFAQTTGYAETKQPLKFQTEQYVQSSNLP